MRTTGPVRWRRRCGESRSGSESGLEEIGVRRRTEYGDGWTLLLLVVVVSVLRRRTALTVAVGSGLYWEEAQAGAGSKSAKLERSKSRTKIPYDLQK